MGYYSELAYDTEVCETNEAPSGKGRGSSHFW